MKKARVFDQSFDFYEYLKGVNVIRCVLIDEAQFLTKAQVLNLAKVVDELSIPVLCYGLRTDFLGEPFEGSKYLLAIADKLVELKTICYCGKKATMNLRKKQDATGVVAISEGAQVDIGGNDKYIALCRKCYGEFMAAN
jgi:thymidine kinase